MDTLARSLYASYRQLWEPAFPFPDDGYPGAYLVADRRAHRDADGERWRAAGESRGSHIFRASDGTKTCAEHQPLRPASASPSIAGRVKRSCTMPAR